MKLGLFMMPLHPPGRILAESYDEDLGLIKHADQVGFSEVWVGEHMLLPWENMPDPQLFIARALGEKSIHVSYFLGGRWARERQTRTIYVARVVQHRA